MDNVGFAFNAVGPLILLILLGVFLRRSDFLPQSFFNQGNKFAFKVLIPCSTFRSVYACPGLSDINGGFMLYGTGIAFVIFFLGLLSTHMMIPERISRSAAHQCTFRSNIAVLGTALANSLAGANGAILLATFMMIIVPLLNVFAVVTLVSHENTSKTRKSVGNVIINILDNPLIIACALGFLSLVIRALLTPAGSSEAVFTLNNSLPFVYKVLDMLASATTTISLIMLGGMVDFAAIGGEVRSIVFGVVWKLVIAPAVAIAGAVLLGWTGMMHFGVAEYAVLLATFGSSIAIGCAPMTAAMGGDAELAGQYVMWTNVFLVISLPIEIIILRMIGLL